MSPAPTNKNNVLRVGIQAKQASRFGASVEIDTGVLASMHAGFEALVARLADGEIIYGTFALLTLRIAY